MDARIVGVIVILISTATAFAQAVNQMPWSEENGLLSVDDGRGGIARSADDFVLPGAPGTNMQVTRIRGVLLIDDVPFGPRSRIEIYDDDGAGFPEAVPAFVFQTNWWGDLGLVAIDPSYRAWEVRVGDGTTPLFTQQAGVRRWVCIVGEHELPFPSGRFFATFDETAPVAGLSARTRLGHDGEWRETGTCCTSAYTDLAFVVEAVTATPSVVCGADADGSGQSNVTDIFVYLSWWFGGLAAADIDGVGGVDVPDIFAFLTLWFAGC